MHIIIRTCGERTTNECIKRAELQGKVHVVKAFPFGESLRQSYKLAITLNQEWIPMIDADVLLAPDTLSRAITYLKKCNKNVFVLDGKTKDKIFCKARRAGIHIYRTSLLSQAMKFINDRALKPESHVRRCMDKAGYKTTVGTIIFGHHDYEQYYCDLWRKAVCQAYKLAGTIRRTNIKNKWKRLAESDLDYRVILAAHEYGKSMNRHPVIDSRIDYGAKEALLKLGIEEKK